MAFFAQPFVDGHVLAQPFEGQNTLRLSASEQYCEEEKQLADRWMVWAAYKRSECVAGTSDRGSQAACIRELSQQLDALEHEYAEIYTSQVRNLRPDHPVVANILRRLRSHKELANTVLLQEDAEPAALAGHLKEACLVAARQPPSVRPPRRR